MRVRSIRTAQASRVSCLVAAASSALVLNGYATGAIQYQSTTVVAIPLNSTDGTSANLPTKYTSVSVSSTGTSAMPEGAYTSLLTGVLSGNTVTGNYSESSAFAYDPTNGFRFVGEYFPTSTGAHANTSISGVNPVLGQVIGSSPINSNQSTDQNGMFGTDAWVSTGVGSTTSLGLTGTNFSYTQTVAANGTTFPTSVTLTHRASAAAYINAAGQVAGTTSRFGGDTSSSPTSGLGQSAYLYTAGSGSTEIGLTGTNYSYNYAATNGGTIVGSYYSNSVAGVSSVGEVIGSATPYYDTATTGTGNTTATNLGKDAWVYTAGTTTPVGYYQQGVDPVGLSAFGIHYYGTTASTVPGTPGYGAVGSAASLSSVRSTTLTGVNTAGQAIGTSQMYNSTGSFNGGLDAFKYTPGTGYQQLGFYTGTPLPATPVAGSSSYINATGVRSTTASYINTPGQVAGTSTLYSQYQNGASVSSTSGSSAFLSGAAGTPTRIGLYGQAADPLSTSTVVSHVSLTGAANSSVTNLTDSGLVGGYSSRYVAGSTTGLGQDAWVYDSNTGTNYELDPTDAANALYTSSQINYLSEDGYAVGRYLASTTTSSSGGYNQSFIWSESGGFESINANVTGLTAAGFQNLIQAYYEGAAGSTVYSAASTTASSNVNGIVSLTAVPEPTGLVFLGMGTVGLIRRRKTV